MYITHFDEAINFLENQVYRLFLVGLRVRQHTLNTQYVDPTTSILEIHRRRLTSSFIPLYVTIWTSLIRHSNEKLVLRDRRKRREIYRAMNFSEKKKKEKLPFK